MKTVQYFSDEYLEECKKLSPMEIIEFIENFRILVTSSPSKSKLISLKVPEALLSNFKAKSKLSNIKYQTKIKELMEDWLKNGSST